MTPIVLHRYERFCANPARTVFVNPACLGTVERIDDDPGRKGAYTRIELMSGTVLTVIEDPDTVLREIHYADVANAALLERN